MKKLLTVCAALLALSAALLTPALADADDGEFCYPTSITVSEDGTQLRKAYDLSPEADPAGIPRSDFELDGFAYTFVDILRQEIPEYEEREYTETVTVDSKKKDMESVLALLPQEREAVTEDGLSGVLTLKLDTVRVEAAGYGSSTRSVSATRTYPNLDGQDTSFIPKTVEDDGRTLTLQTVKWETVGSEGGERYTATATYTGTASSSYVSGYTVTADYAGTVSRVALDRVRYVAIFSGTDLNPEEREPDEEQADGANPSRPAEPPDAGESGDAGNTIGEQGGSSQQTGQVPADADDSDKTTRNIVFVALGAIVILFVGVAVALIIDHRSRRYYDDDENDLEEK